MFTLGQLLLVLGAKEYVHMQRTNEENKKGKFKLAQNTKAIKILLLMRECQNVRNFSYIGKSNDVMTTSHYIIGKSWWVFPSISMT